MRLVGKHPLRVIDLLDAMLSTWSVQTGTGEENERAGKRPSDEDWDEKADEALRDAANQHPSITWDLLIPHIERLTRANGTGSTKSNHSVDEDGFPSIHQDYKKMSRGLLRMLIEAARALAKHTPEKFLSRAQGLSSSKSSAISRILLEGYSNLSAPYADFGIEWLLSDLGRIRGNGRYGETKWIGVRLIKKLSPDCSEAQFVRLENGLVHYHPPEEKKTVKYYLEKSREGYYRPWFGEAQFFLLPALAPYRRSTCVENLITVLKRKFGQGGRFLRPSLTGDVVSPLRTEILHKISDRMWMAIVTNKKITEDSWPKKRKDGRYANSSIGNFSSSLRWIAKRQPNRFAQLVLRFPPDVNRRYIGAILDSVKAVKPENLSEEEKTGWTPASRESVEAILERFPPENDLSAALEFCWLIEARPDEMWSQGVVDRLVEYATQHSHPELSKFRSGSGKTIELATIHDLEQEKLNSVRGVAGLAISALLWKHSDWFDRLRPGIEHLIEDPHPAVRIASLGACVATAANINKDLAVGWFRLASEDDDRVPASRMAVYLFNSAIHTHFDVLSEIVRKMLKSRFEDVVKEGASEVVARWLFRGMFERELENCRKASAAHREGIARVAAHFLGEKEYFERCRELLSPLLNDVNREVRAAASAAFRHGKILEMPEIPSLCRVFVNCKAFEDDPSHLLYAFQGYTGSTLPYEAIILEIVNKFTGPLLEKSRDFSTGIAHDIHLLSPLLLRLYDQSRDSGRTETANRCLDAWDAMFEKRIGVVRDLMKDIDR
jgi:hypothetical protein